MSHLGQIDAYYPYPGLVNLHLFCKCFLANVPGSHVSFLTRKSLDFPCYCAAQLAELTEYFFTKICAVMGEGGHLQQRGWAFEKQQLLSRLTSSCGYCTKCLPSVLQMTTLSPTNDYPLSFKWVPSVLQMLTLYVANGYPLSCKWVPSLLQMTTLSPANGYPVCCK